MTADLRQRRAPQQPPDGGDDVPAPNLTAGASTAADPNIAHPSGKRKKGRWTQLLRQLTFATYFIGSCCT